MPAAIEELIQLAKEMREASARRNWAYQSYPPGKQEKATQTMLEQAALLSAEWAAA